MKKRSILLKYYLLKLVVFKNYRGFPQIVLHFIPSFWTGPHRTKVAENVPWMSKYNIIDWVHYSFLSSVTFINYLNCS